MATDLERLIVTLQADVRGYQAGMQKALGITNKNARAIENRYRQMSTSISRAITAPIAGIGAALGTREIMKYADAWTQAGNLIRSAASASGVQTRSLEEIRKGADDARTSLETYSSLYASLIRSASGVAKSEEEIATATNLVAKAMKAGGAGVAEQQAAILQLGQALGSGVLQGDELRSLKENAPVIAKAIADEFGVTVASLKKLGEEGKLTSERVFRAILNAQKPIEAQFAQTNATISDGFTKLSNAVTEYVGKAAEATGVTGAINSILSALAGNIENVAAAAAAAGAVILSRYVPALARAAISQAAMVATNPFLLLATGIGAAAFALTAFGDEITPVQGQLASLGDYAATIWGSITGAVTTAAAAISDAFLGTISYISEAMGGLSVTWADVGNFIKGAINAQIGMIVAAYNIIVATFTKLPAAIGEQVINGVNVVIKAIEDMANKAVHAINATIEAVNRIPGVELGTLDDVSLGRVRNQFEGAGKAAGEAYVEGVKGALSKDYLGDVFSGVQSKAEERAQRRSETAGAGYDAPSTEGYGSSIGAPPPPSDTGSKGRKKGRTRKDELEREIDQIKKRTAAIIGQTEAQSGLNPYIEDYGYALAKAEAQQDLLSAAQAAGITLTAEQRQKIEELAEAYAQATAAKGQLDESQSQVADGIQAINDARKDSIRGLIDDLVEGKLSADSFADALKNIGTKLIDIAMNSMFSGPNGGFNTGIFGGGGIFSGLFGGGSVGAPATGTGFLASLYHDGGIVGRDGTPRAVHPSVFRGARRYHTGGVAGLVPGEVPAILQRGERVLTRGEQAAMGGGGRMDVRVYVDQDGNWQAAVANIAGPVAARVVDKRAPGAVAKSRAYRE